MIRSSTSGVQEWYQTLSGHTTATGPASQICRQSALVRWTPPLPASPSSFSRRLRNFHEASPSAREQHFCFSEIAHRKM